MERHQGEPRPGWEKIVEGQGMVYGVPGRGQGGAPRPYWDESVHYTFSMDEVLSRSLSRRRFSATLLALFSLVGLFLAAIGLYGVVSYSVEQRTQEIGIRMALGSSKILVVRLILREGLQLVTIGLLAGLAAALASTRLLGGFLYAVPPLDPVTFSLAPVLLFVAALAACLMPGYRAATIDPMNALRHE